MTKLTVAGWAELAAMSLSHFARVFKLQTGRPPLEYLLELRLEKARQLLRVEDLPVTEIALRCGFGTSSHFAATFQQRLGTTPRHYRAAITAGASPARLQRLVP